MAEKKKIEAKAKKTKAVKAVVSPKQKKAPKKPAKAEKSASREKPAKATKPVKENEASKEAQSAFSPQKQEIIGKFQIKSNDTGSPEVQIALLTSRIDKLVGHLKSNPQDNHSRRGLLGIISKRRRLLHYLETRDMKRYKEIAKKVGLAK